MNNSILTSLQGSFDHLSRGINNTAKLDDFNDGADVFGATPFRCFPQFFFYLHLPNQWHDNAGGGWAEIDGVNLGGPILAFSIISYILGAGYYFMKCEESRHIKALLTEEVLLSYFALKKKAEEEKNIELQFKDTFIRMDAFIQEQIDRDKKVHAGYWLYQLFSWRYEGHEEKRINQLKTIAETNAGMINTILCDNSINVSSSADSATSPASPKSHARQIWEKTYDVVVYYSYAHWIFWMISTIVLYQTTEGYGINEANPSRSDPPAWYTDKAMGFSEYDAALIFQTVAPFIFALAVVASKSFVSPKPDATKANETLQQIRVYHLKKTAAEGSDFIDETHRHFYLSQSLTAVTTFIATFIITNVAAWPIQGFAMKVCNIETKDSTYIPIIFAITAAAALIQAGLKVYDMRQQEKDYFGSEGSFSIRTTSQKPTLWQFYTSPDHSHKLWYYGPGVLFGSIGVLKARILFNGGAGNMRATGEIQAMDRSDIMLIGLCLTAVMICLKMAQYYALTQRNEVLKTARDQKLCSRL